MYVGVIYRYYIINNRGKEISYIGQTCSEKQRKQDFLNINTKYGGSRIENARRKYGPENFKYEILKEIQCQTIEKRNTLLNEYEKYYIELFASFRCGYNNTIGGGGANGYQHTEKYKRWQSNKSKELEQNPEYIKKISAGIISFYEKDPNARIRKSEETRRRYSNPLERDKTNIIQRKSYAINPDRAKKHSDKLKKICNTPEGRKRMSETIKNAWKTKEYREKYSNSKKALWATKEYREKMAIAYKGMNGKKVLQSTFIGAMPIKEFESASEAARQLGFSFGGIARVCRGERIHYKGFKWNYIN
jgi:group I intron endonuclease